MLYKKQKYHFLLANIWKPRRSKSDPEPVNALYQSTPFLIFLLPFLMLAEIGQLGSRLDSWVQHLSLISVTDERISIEFWLVS